jgi:hypothetical protein
LGSCGHLGLVGTPTWANDDDEVSSGPAVPAARTRVTASADDRTRVAVPDALANGAPVEAR